MLDIGGLGFDTPVVYRAMTDYWGENETLSDEMWNSINTDAIQIAADDDWALEHDLPLSGRFPWDDSKGLYFVKSVHDMHCLVCIIYWLDRTGSD